MSVKFKPLADRVLIEPAPAEQKTASGIIIPDTAKEKPLKGTVIAAGPGKKALLESNSEIEVIVVDVSEQEIERPKKKNRNHTIVASRDTTH